MLNFWQMPVFRVVIVNHSIREEGIIFDANIQVDSDEVRIFVKGDTEEAISFQKTFASRSPILQRQVTLTRRQPKKPEQGGE